MTGPVAEDAMAIVVPPVVWHAALAHAIDPANGADDRALAELIPPPELPALDPLPLDDDLLIETASPRDQAIEDWPDHPDHLVDAEPDQD